MIVNKLSFIILLLFFLTNTTFCLTNTTFCLTNTTFQGFPNLVKPGHLILKVLWTPFLLLALAGCFYVVGQTIVQYKEFSYTTMTVIRREPNMTMPSVTICGPLNNENKFERILLGCKFGLVGDSCLQDKLINYNRNCVRLNFGSNATILQKSVREGLEYGYFIRLYIPKGAYVLLAVTDNNVLAVNSDINKRLINGETIEMFKYFCIRYIDGNVKYRIYSPCQFKCQLKKNV